MSNITGKVVASALGAAAVVSSSLVGAKANETPSPSQAAAAAIEALAGADTKSREMEGK